MSIPDARRTEMLRLIDSAQRVAGVVAARDRGDKAGAAALVDSFKDDGSMSSGSLLLVEMILQLHRRQTGQSVQDALQELTVQLEASVRAAS